jgi:hypothetical protein
MRAITNNFDDPQHGSKPVPLAPERVDKAPQYGAVLTAGETGAAEPPPSTRPLLDINNNGHVEGNDFSSFLFWSLYPVSATISNHLRFIYIASQRGDAYIQALKDVYGADEYFDNLGDANPLEYGLVGQYIATGGASPFLYLLNNNNLDFPFITDDGGILYIDGYLGSSNHPGATQSLNGYVAEKLSDLGFGVSISGNGGNTIDISWDGGDLSSDSSSLHLALAYYLNTGDAQTAQGLMTMQWGQCNCPGLTNATASWNSFLTQLFDDGYQVPPEVVPVLDYDFYAVEFTEIPPGLAEMFSSVTDWDSLLEWRDFADSLGFPVFYADPYLDYVIENVDEIALVFGTDAQGLFDLMWAERFSNMSYSGGYTGGSVASGAGYNQDGDSLGQYPFLEEWFRIADGYNLTGEYVDTQDLGIWEDPDLFFENYYNFNTIFAANPEIMASLPPNWPDYNGDGQFDMSLMGVAGVDPGAIVEGQYYNDLFFLPEFMQGLDLTFLGVGDNLFGNPTSASAWDSILNNELYQQFAQESDYFNFAWELGYLCCGDNDPGYEAWSFGSNAGGYGFNGGTGSTGPAQGGLGLFDPGFLVGLQPGEFSEYMYDGINYWGFDRPDGAPGGYTGMDMQAVVLFMYMTANDLWGDPEWNPVSWEYWSQEGNEVGFEIASNIDEDSIDFLNGLSQEAQDYLGWTDSPLNIDLVPYEQVEPAFTQFLESGVSFDTNGDGVVTQLDIDAIFAILTEGQAEPYIINGVEFTSEQLMAAIAQFAANNETEFSLTDGTVVTWVEWGAFLDGGLAFLSDYYPDATLGEMFTAWGGFYNEGLAVLQSLNPEATTSEMLATWLSYVEGGQSYLTTANPDATTAELLDIWISYVEQGEGYLSQSNPDATTDELLAMWIDYLSYTPTAPELPFDISDPSTWDPNFVYQGDFNQTTDPTSASWGFNPNVTSTYSVYVDENGVPGALPLTDTDQEWLTYWGDFIAENGFDFNLDGVINSSDWTASLEDPNSGDTLFDWNGDGLFNIYDTLIVDTSVGWSGSPASGDFNPSYQSAIGLSFSNFDEILSGEFGQYGADYYNFLQNSFWGYGWTGSGTSQLSDPVFGAVTPFGYWSNEGEWVWFIDPETNPFVAPLGLEGGYDYSLFNAIAAYVMGGSQLDPSLLGIDMTELDPELLALIGTDVASYDPTAGYFTADQLASFDFDGDGAITEFDYNVMDYIMYQAGQGVTSFDDYFGNQFNIFSPEEVVAPPPPDGEINAAEGAYIPKRIGVRKRMKTTT